MEINLNNGKLENFKIHRALIKSVARLTYKQAEGIILDYEWLGTMGTTQMHYGIFFEGVQLASYILNLSKINLQLELSKYQLRSKTSCNPKRRANDFPVAY